MAAGGEEELSNSFTDSFSSTSSSFSSVSVSESNSTELTSSSEVDSQAFADEGIYGRILSLIDEGRFARFTDRCNGIYELDWQDVVWKYWHEWREARRDANSNIKNDKFNIRTASNNLRAALLNSYKHKGAKEYPEKKVLDNQNKTIKRCFRMPSNVVDKLARISGHCVSKLNENPGSAVGLVETSESVCDGCKTTQSNEGTVVYSSPLRNMDFSSLNIDAEESDSLISYMISPDDDHHNIDDLIPMSNDHDLIPSSSSDWTATSQYDAESSGYETGADENLVKEIDPCEGPYQGGNMSFIFLEQSLRTRFPEAGNRCKVVFSSPKHRFMSPREVLATVKNCFTIKVRVPRCPRLSGKQLAHDKLTVQVLVKTLEGSYIGETTYTYVANLMSQLEQCVRALDDEDMELDFTGSSDEHHIAMCYKGGNITGGHFFTFATLRALVFVAVKEKAYNFLLAFLKSSVVSSVFQHCKHKLVPFLVQAQKSERRTNRSALELEMCKKLLLESAASHEALKQSNEDTQETMEKSIENGYDGGSELETQELEVSFNDLNDSSTLKHKEEMIESGSRFERGGSFFDVEHRCETEVTDTSARFTCSLSTDDKKTMQDQEERKQDHDELSKPKIFVLRKPCSPVPISRSRSSFPDPRTDIFVELQVRNKQRTSGDRDNQDDALEHVTEHVPVNKQLVEHVSNAKRHVSVEVKHNGTEQSAKDWEAKYVKRVSGRLGYWFRFYEPNCELLLLFTLYDKPHTTKFDTKLKAAVLDHVTVVVETISWKGPSSRETKGEKEPDKRELAITRQVPLLSLSRSQTKLCIIMNRLHELCDNGEWAKFDEECETLRKSRDSDVQVAILLEKAIAFLYQRDLEKAEATALEALGNVSKAENCQLLIGRAYYYLAHVYRREKKLGEAVRCIDLSKQNLHLMDVCLDQSFLAYEEGNVMKEFISSGSVLRKKLLLRAKQCFERCLDLSRRLDDNDSRVIPHTHSFALIKIAMLLLDCGSTSGRERCVSSDHVQEASRFLDRLQSHSLDDITQRRKLQFLLARSDLCYRLSNYQGAVHEAHQALEKAKELGFLLEVMPARDRIYHIRQLVEGGGGGGVYACPEL